MVVTASGKLGDHELTDIPVLNPGDWFGHAWLIEIGCGYSSIYFVVEAGSVEDAIDEFCDSEHGHHIRVEPDRLGDYPEDSRAYAGNASEVVDLDNAMVHGLGIPHYPTPKRPPFDCRYHADGLPPKGISPLRFDAWRDWRDSRPA